MPDSAAARIAEALRTAMKAQSLNGADLADRIERLTGTRPSPTWVSRRLGGRRIKGLVDVDPDLFVIARALEINRDELTQLVTDAIFGKPTEDGCVLSPKHPFNIGVPNTPEENR